MLTVSCPYRPVVHHNGKKHLCINLTRLDLFLLTYFNEVPNEQVDHINNLPLTSEVQILNYVKK